jgi:DNA-binding SARP family transcriptional activator
VAFSTVLIMRFDVLGPLRVTGPDGPVPIPRGRTAATVCWLVANMNERVSFAGLADVLWSDPPIDAAAKAGGIVRTLQPLLGPALEVGRYAVLRLSPGDIDSVRFERLLDAAFDKLDRGEHLSVEDDLVEALRWWRGSPYPELDRALPVMGLVDRLEELRLRAEEELGALAMRGQVDYPHVARLRSLTIRHPDRLRFHHQLAQALYRCGRQIEALQELAGLRARGCCDARTLALSSAILQQAAALAEGEFR